MSERKPLSSFWQPKYWPTWIGMGLLRLVCLLPHRTVLAIGRVIGRVAHTIGGSRRAIVRRNIELCFPEKTAQERDALAHDHFEAMGISFMEMGLGRWASDKHLESITTLEGVEHLNNALETGHGVILLSAHFTTIEISGRVLKLRTAPYDGVYRKNRSEFIDELQRTGRECSVDKTIEKRDIKKMVRSLKSGRAVWYAADQSYRAKGAEVIEFFGVPAMQITATTTLARLGNAIVIPFFPMRNADGTYTHTIYPPLEGVPSKDAIADTKKYIAALEAHVRKCPEQYFWIHRKFKGLPDGYPDYYSDLEALK